MHCPVAGVHVFVAPASSAWQSVLELHSTHWPAMALLVVSPHTVASGSVLEVHGVPVVVYVTLGPSGPVPLPFMPPGMHAGLLSHEVATGRFWPSSTDVVPPLPSHTVFWQVPSGVDTTVLLPGKTHAPGTGAEVGAQLVAPHVPPVTAHAAMQQFPVPSTSQTFDTHSSSAVHAVPAARVPSATHAPAALQKTPVPAQSASEAHDVLQAVPVLSQMRPPAQAADVPATQPVAVLQVCARVNVLPVHEAAAQVVAVPAEHVSFDVLQVPAEVNVAMPPVVLQLATAQSVLVLQPTQPLVLQVEGQFWRTPAMQPVVGLQLAAGVNVLLPPEETQLAAAQVCWVLATQTWFVQVCPGVYVLPLHDPCGQSVSALHWTQLPAPSHLVSPAASLQVAPEAALVVPQQSLSHVAMTHAVLGTGQAVATVAVVHAVPPTPQGLPLSTAASSPASSVLLSGPASVPPVPVVVVVVVLEVVVLVVVEVVVLVVVEVVVLVVPPVPTAPPVPGLEPPVLGIRDRSTEAMSSQPVMLAVSAPAATTKAVRMLMWFFM
jgi:hypothetical protein